MDNQTLYQTLKTAGYHGFRLEETHFIKELQCDMWILSHKSSGLSLVYINAPDREKSFGLSFALCPVDDTGVAHIIEHTLLCGSKKYPSKEWGGDNLLCSFYSAFTMRDSYFYPVASTNEKSFQELVKIYADFIFDPLLLENDLSMLQEGWHYEYDAETDKLSYSGIVYSEMRAAYAMPDFILADAQLRAACPNTSLANNVGGAPSCIPKLTRIQFLETYRDIFRAENCLCYVYGDTCLSDILDTLTPYISRHHRADGRLSVKGEPSPFTGKPHIEYYPADVSEDAERKKDIVSLNWILPSERETVIKATVLAELISARLAVLLPSYRISVSCMQDYYWPMLSIVLRDTDGEQISAINDQIFDALRRMKADSFSATDIEAACNNCQFTLAEKVCFVPEGINYGIKVTSAWAHNKQPWEALEYEACLEQLSDTDDLTEFNAMIESLLLENPFYSQLVLMADSQILEREKAQESQQLLEFRAQLTEEELAEIIKNTERLHHYQSTPDDPAVLALLPKTEISDLEKSAPVRYPQLVDTCSGTVLFAETSSSIIENAVYFDLSQLSPDELHIAGILRLLFGKFPCGGQSIEQAAQYVRTLTNGIQLTIKPFYSGTTDTLKAVLDFKTFQKYFQDAQALVKTMLYQADYENADLAKNILSRALNAYTADQIDIVSRAKAHYSSANAAMQHISGYEFYQYLKALLADFETQYPFVIEGLNHLLSHQLNPAKATIALSCRESILEEIKHTLSFSSSLYESRCTFPLYDSSEVIRNAGIMQYLAYAGKVSETTGALLASAKLAKILATIPIRSIGGAYTVGAHASFNGEILMNSGRDPHLGQTLRSFQALPEQIRSADDNQIQTAIITTASDFGKMPKAGVTGFLSYSEFELAIINYFCGIHPEKQQQLWEMLLTASPEEVRACADNWEEVLSNHAYCALASEEKIKKDGHMFAQIIEL